MVGGVRFGSCCLQACPFGPAFAKVWEARTEVLHVLSIRVFPRWNSWKLIGSCNYGWEFRSTFAILCQLIKLESVVVEETKRQREPRESATWQADFDSMVWIQAVAFYIAYLDGLHVKFFVLQLLSTVYHSMCIVSICWWPCWEACFHCFCKASGAQQKSFYFSWLKWSGSHGCLRAMFLLMCSWKPRGRRRPTCESN